MKIYFITFATDIDKCFLLKKSCEQNNISLIILGLNEEWKGFGTKYIKIKEYLESDKQIRENDFIIFNDGYDTFCQDNYESIYQKITPIPEGKILVSCEIYLWPLTILEYKSYFDTINQNSKYRYPCSGQYLGRKKDLLNFYNKMNVSFKDDDQEAFIKFCISDKNKVMYDLNCNIFQPNLFLLENNESHYQNKNKRFSRFVNDDLRFYIKNNMIKLENMFTKTQPSFIHANGVNKEYLIDLFRKYINPLRTGLNCNYKHLLPQCKAIVMPDREKYLHSVLNTYGIPYTPFSAIKGREYTLDNLFKDRIIFSPNIKLTLGEIGCYLSHANVFNDFHSNPKLDKLMVFEDDIRIPNYITGKWLGDYILEALQKVPKDCDILYLGRCYDYCGKTEPVNDLIVRVFNPLCMHAYILFRSGFEKLKDILPIHDAIDRYLVNKIQFQGMKAYATNPPLVMQNNNLKSNVQKHENNYTPVCGEDHSAIYIKTPLSGDFLTEKEKSDNSEIKKEEQHFSLKEEDKEDKIKEDFVYHQQKKSNKWIFILIFLAILILGFLFLYFRGSLQGRKSIRYQKSQKYNTIKHLD